MAVWYRKICKDFEVKFSWVQLLTLTLLTSYVGLCKFSDDSEF